MIQPNRGVMKCGERTLVKSQPELWELVTHPGRMQGWMSALLGHAAEIEIAEQDPEQRLVWTTAGSDDAKITLALDKSGWGTKVTVEAEGANTKLEGWADAVLDELAATERRPFQGVI